MIESTVIALLHADSLLASKVTTYNSLPAIFADQAPEDAVKPYIVFHISNMARTEDSILFDGDLQIDFYDFGPSWANCDIAMERIENLLDQQVLQSPRLNDVRVSLDNSGPIPESDPREIHYNSVFSIRGIRKRWIIQH